MFISDSLVISYYIHWITLLIPTVVRATGSL
nr:MAG TPA: hypothetical protein [Caudoviricetes sp.]